MFPNDRIQEVFSTLVTLCFRCFGGNRIATQLKEPSELFLENWTDVRVLNLKVSREGADIFQELADDRL